MGRVIKNRVPGARLKAESLFETIVALVIILTLFGIATTLFVRVESSTVSMKKMSAEQVLRAYAETTRREHQFFDSQEMIDSFTVKRQVVAMDQYSNLWRVHYYIFGRANELLAQWQQYMIPED